MKYDLLRGELAPPRLNITDAQAFYLEVRNDQRLDRSDFDKKKFRQHVERYCDFLKLSLGQDKFIEDISREDARQFLKFLLARGLKPASINKALGVISALLSFCFQENDIDRRNPFKGIKAEESVLEREKRRSFTDSEVEDCLNAFSSRNHELCNIATIFAFSGARPVEVSGLLICDVSLDGNIPYISIAPNATRKLKNSRAKRTVPLVYSAVEAARDALKRAKGRRLNDLLFVNYFGPQGEERLSGAMDSAIRKKLKIDAPRLVAYSLRHRMKDKFRDALIDDKLSKSFFGRGSKSQGDFYTVMALHWNASMRRC